MNLRQAAKELLEALEDPSKLRRANAISDLRKALEADQDAKDAERYRWLRSKVRGNYDSWDQQRFFLPRIEPAPGANIMHGSVAQHFDAAIDQARRERG